MRWFVVVPFKFVIRCFALLIGAIVALIVWAFAGN